jgi:hypothetical protein
VDFERGRQAKRLQARKSHEVRRSCGVANLVLFWPLGFMQNVTIDARGSIDQAAADHIAAVEQWARAKGWWWEARPKVAPWWVTHRGAAVTIRRALEPGLFASSGHDVSPHAALVWALVLEARPLRDWSSCKRCRGRGFKVIVPTARVVPCSDCEGTGLADVTDAYAQHVLDAQRPCGVCKASGWTRSSHTVGAIECWSCSGNGTEPGNPASIEALHVLADRLQPDLLRRADGPPRDPDREALGFHLAHLLAGSREGTAAAAEQLREFSRCPAR